MAGIEEPPLLSTTQRPPQFGRQKVQILDQGHVLVHATSETIVAEKGEDAAAVVHRLMAQRGMGPADAVEIVYKAGAPQRAIVEWGKGAARSRTLAAFVNGHNATRRDYYGGRTQQGRTSGSAAGCWCGWARAPP